MKSSGKSTWNIKALPSKHYGYSHRLSPRLLTCLERVVSRDDCWFLKLIICHHQPLILSHQTDLYIAPPICSEETAVHFSSTATGIAIHGSHRNPLNHMDYHRSQSSVVWSGHSIPLHAATCVKIDESIPYFGSFCVSSEMSVLLQSTNPVSWRTALPQANDTQNTIALSLPPFEPARFRNEIHPGWTSSFSWHLSHPSWFILAILWTLISKLQSVQSIDVEPYHFRWNKMHQISGSSISTAALYSITSFERCFWSLYQLVSYLWSSHSDQRRME